MGIRISDSITMHDFQIIVKTFIIILNLQTTAIVGLTEWLDGPLRKVFLFLQMTIISHSTKHLWQDVALTLLRNVQNFHNFTPFWTEKIRFSLI